jgi:hypothetical protein
LNLWNEHYLEISLMDERTPKYTMTNDYDQHGDLSANDDRLTQYLITFVPRNLMVAVTWVGYLKGLRTPHFPVG